MYYYFFVYGVLSMDPYIRILYYGFVYKEFVLWNMYYMNILYYGSVFQNSLPWLLIYGFFNMDIYLMIF